MVRLGWLALVVLLAACTSTVAPSPSPAATVCPKPGDNGYPHQAPEIEAALPATVAGRVLTRWSVRGRCWLELAYNSPADIDTVVSRFTTPSNPNPIDNTNLVHGVAGRSTLTDPPFFVFAAVRPANDAEVSLALVLLFGMAKFHDIYAGTDLQNYQQRTVAGKRVYVGTIDMLNQDTHQRGRPFLYQTDQHMFVVITDDDAWAAEAIGKLP